MAPTTIEGPFVLVNGPNRYDLTLKSFLYGEYVSFELDPKGKPNRYGGVGVGIKVAGIWRPPAANDLQTEGDYFHFFGIVEMAALRRYCRGFFNAGHPRQGVIFCSDSHMEVVNAEIPEDFQQAVMSRDLTALRRVVALHRKRLVSPA